MEEILRKITIDEVYISPLKRRRKITIDEVYISPLKRRRVRREDGSEIMEEVPHAIRPSGSMIMDAVVQILFFRRVFQINQIARILGVDPVKLAGAMQILTGMPMQDFLNIFRLYLVQEYLACTDLSLSQIAACCDFSSQSSLSHVFTKEIGCSPAAYRRSHRHRDFRFWYEW